MCIACDNAWARLGASLYANSLAVTTDLLRQFTIAASQAKIYKRLSCKLAKKCSK